MFWLIENKDQINSFRIKGYKKAFVEVIPFSNTVHPVLNNISLVYIKPLNGDKGYMVTIDHSEAFTIENSLLTELLDGIETIYVRDKKKFCTLVTKLTFGKVCFGWCVEPIEPKKEVKKTPKKKTTKKKK